MAERVRLARTDPNYEVAHLENLEQLFKWLDDPNKKGEYPFFDAPDKLEAAFPELSPLEASSVIKAWMRTF